MFFVLSKILWMVAAPTNLAVAVLVLGSVLLGLGRSTWGRRLAIAATAVIALGGFLPLGTLSLLPLENRFPRPLLDGLDPAGIIVLGGGIDQETGAARGQTTLADAGSRVTEGAVLARRFPSARLVYTGGSNALVDAIGNEARDAKRLWVALGIDSDRVMIEDKSRNTAENAEFTRVLLRPQPEQRWILVTSAYHMPRSVGLFRAAGFGLVPYPVDYRTTGTWRDLEPNRDVSFGLARLDFALREWIGLVAYRLAGKTDALLPAP